MRALESPSPNRIAISFVWLRMFVEAVVNNEKKLMSSTTNSKIRKIFVSSD